jgi:hypothetical protein
MDNGAIIYSLPTVEEVTMDTIILEFKEKTQEEKGKSRSKHNKL